MKGTRVLAAVLMSAFLMTATAFAAQDTPASTDTGTPGQHTKAVKKDPLQMLENYKANIEKRLSDGKISKDKADKMTAALDKRLQQLNEFNSLSPEQKKEKLIGNFTSAVNKRVADGKLTQDKANDMIAKYKEKISAWDGNGYPASLSKNLNTFRKNFAKNHRSVSAGKLNQALDSAVKDGKITDQQKQDLLNYLKEKKQIN